MLLYTRMNQLWDGICFEEVETIATGEVDDRVFFVICLKFFRKLLSYPNN